MFTPAPGFPQHICQPQPWGCQVYSFYALTGNERILEIVDECCSHRFTRHTQQLGYYVLPVYSNKLYTCPTPAEWWREYTAQITDGTAPLLLTIKSPAVYVGYHSVAALLSREEVIILDPSAAGQKQFTMEQFLATPYARAYDVDYVAEWDQLLQDHPPVFGPDQPHVSPTTRERYFAEKRQAIVVE